jgi:nucleoid DNA-binding protein
MTKQKEILNKLAKSHDISIGQAEEIWDLFINKINTTISDTNKKDEAGLYDLDKFKTIHIDNFGKFIPNVRNIRHANMCLEKKNKKKK